MKKSLFLLLLIGLLIGSAFGYDEPQASTSELRLVISELIRSYEEEDIKEIRKIYSADITLYLPDIPFRIEGITSFVKELEQNFKDNSRIRMAVRQVEIRIEDNIAVENGYWSTSCIYRNEPLVTHGRYTRLWRKSNEGKWRCFHEHLSYLPTP